ncbi:MAG: RNA polymerase sigma factor [Desulfobulbaceae bacterium]|nr:RNA polymerase sigma factor [Candidatus Kapabacteria bacterium]MBS4001549.1 RNA polymerase sigma factor [Desulfobulbaceae bacterium]
MLFKKKNIAEDELQNATKALNHGSAEAFHLLYQNYAPKVYRYCVKMLGDEILAEDAFQETFVRIYEKRDAFNGQNFSAWLFTIARNTCYNYLRQKKEHESYDETFHQPDRTSNQDIGLKDQIDKAMQMLPVPLREAVILREYEECTYQEIADILQIELSLAKIRVYRARIILRKLLQPLVKEINES